MTPAQRMTLQKLERDGFKMICQSKEIVRVTRNGDNRVIMADGSQKRAHHQTPAKPGERFIKKGR